MTVSDSFDQSLAKGGGAAEPARLPLNLPLYTLTLTHIVIRSTMLHASH